MCKFYSDIEEVRSQVGFYAIRKSKRDRKYKPPKKIQNNYEKLEGFGWLTVPPNVSAFRLIDNVDFVICVPFTSPALFAASREIPVIYYDPTGTVSARDRNNLGILLVQTTTDLEYVIRRAMKKKLQLIDIYKTFGHRFFIAIFQARTRLDHLAAQAYPGDM